MVCLSLPRSIALLGLTTAGVLAALLAGCSGSPKPTPTSADDAPATRTPALVPTPTPAPTAVAGAGLATPLPSPDGSAAARAAYDPNETMWGIFSGLGHQPATTLGALEQARTHGDRSQVTVIVEIMRFFGDPAVDRAYTLTLQELTGASFVGDPERWLRWMEWLGGNLDHSQPPPDYLDWKVNLLSLTDPRMGGFLASAPGKSRIDLAEVVWGGVRTDGIPDLRDPRVLRPEDADYLLPDDRVFGVSINGEQRAYPLRVVNAHEMVNDRLGGEPIALAY